MAHDVFISYAEEDKSTANAACTTLESESISCWIAPRDIRPRFFGEPFSRSELGFLRIENISGRTVRLQTVRFGERPPPRKEISINVDEDGNITLIPEKNAPQKAS
jgi:hypothetical protein